MIDPKELRIGNWIKRKGSIFDEANIMITRTNINLFDCNYFDPIPLTPDVAYKLQVNNAGITHGLFEMNFYEEFSFTFCKVEPNTILLRHEDVYTGVKLKYLHQLQNLYFALSGEELIVNF